MQAIGDRCEIIWNAALISACPSLTVTQWDNVIRHIGGIQVKRLNIFAVVLHHPGYLQKRAGFHAACCTNLLRPVVDRFEEPLRNDTLFPFYDICRTCIFVIAATSHCDWSTSKICPPLNWRQWNTSDGVNSYYAAPGIQALNGDNCCACSSSYDHQPS